MCENKSNCLLSPLLSVRSFRLFLSFPFFFIPTVSPFMREPVEFVLFFHFNLFIFSIRSNKLHSAIQTNGRPYQFWLVVVMRFNHHTNSNTFILFSIMNFGPQWDIANWTIWWKLNSFKEFALVHAIVWTKQSREIQQQANTVEKNRSAVCCLTLKLMLVACWCSFALLSADGTQANRWHNNVILESCAIHLSFVVDRHDDFSIIYISFYFGFNVWVASVAPWSYTLLLLFWKVSDHVCCRLSFGWCQRKCVCGFRFTYFIFSHFSYETSSIRWRSHLRMLFLDCRLPTAIAHKHTMHKTNRFFP